MNHIREITILKVVINKAANKRNFKIKSDGKEGHEHNIGTRNGQGISGKKTENDKVKRKNNEEDSKRDTKKHKDDVNKNLEKTTAYKIIEPHGETSRR
jgi:hypothetical protein